VATRLIIVFCHPHPVDCHYDAKSGCLWGATTAIDTTKPHWLIVVAGFLVLAKCHEKV